MYQNDSIDDYIRSILGYPNNNNMYIENTQMDYSGMNGQSAEERELESCYPDIYKRVYPLISSRCLNVTEPISREQIDNMTDEIYSTVEVNNEINLNINLQNSTSTTNTMPENRTSTSKSGNRNYAIKESRSENRQVRDRSLQDLIRILIIRELLNKRRRPRPPFFGRPHFPGENRPPIRPRGYAGYNLYEQQWHD